MKEEATPSIREGSVPLEVERWSGESCGDLWRATEKPKVTGSVSRRIAELGSDCRTGGRETFHPPNLSLNLVFQRHQGGQFPENGVTPLPCVQDMKDPGKFSTVVIHHGERRLPVYPKPFAEGLLGVILAAFDRRTTHGTGIALMPPVQHLPERSPATGAGEALEDSRADCVLREIEERNKIKGRRNGIQGGIQTLGLDHGPRKAIENEGRTIDVDP